MKPKSPLNKTLEPLPEDLLFFENDICYRDSYGTLYASGWQSLPLENASVDLLIADPPYNLSKDFRGFSFKKQSEADYIRYTEEWVGALKPALAPNASVYVCCDWQSSSAVFTVLARHFSVLNRITWEREKGRGALRNWKNTSEDIWFAVTGKEYEFHADAVKLKKKVLAPYKDPSGSAKDWQESPDGRHRFTHPSNLWTDLTVPYWSMAENTPHPTQKPEKLLAKLILASSSKGSLILDPFCGSGSTLAAAKKLERRFIGSEINPYYAAVARRRLLLADGDTRIQGYENGVFKDRNLP